MNTKTLTDIEKSLVSWHEPCNEIVNGLVVHIREQEKYAELGRLAIEVSNTNPAITSFCKTEYQKEYHGADTFCYTVKCPWRNFCLKRAELLVVSI